MNHVDDVEPGTRDEVDVVIVGAGLAGLTLARQIRQRSDRRVLIVDRRSRVPGERQKVGESTVQVGGYYFSKVLDLEELLFRDHLMKYNLRFYWKSAERPGDDFEDYSQVYLRHFSNIACYQLDRNTFEAELVRLNAADPDIRLETGIEDLEVTLGQHFDHVVRYRVDGAERQVRTRWLVDASGRGSVLARKAQLRAENGIRHGTSFAWVEGLVDIERLSRASLDEARLRPSRRATGHLPQWLATNHFMGRGFWFWVIPLRGKTSLGLVYDAALVDSSEVSGAGRLVDWVCREFPLFADDLRARRVLDHGSYRSFSYGCRQTFDRSGWAMTGEAGRFTDPLYSPGSDLIALHNSLITSLVLLDDPAEAARRCELYEHLVRALNDGLLPSYSVGYDALGDPETFSLKYTWELAVYFAFYVFPFVNDLFPDPRFGSRFLERFAKLGLLNKRLQALLSAFHRWKAASGAVPGPQVFHELRSLAPLARAEELFYEVGVERRRACRLLDERLADLTELARFAATWIAARVVGDVSRVHERPFVEAIASLELEFDEAAFVAAATVARGERYPWSLDPAALAAFVPSARPQDAAI